MRIRIICAAIIVVVVGFAFSYSSRTQIPVQKGVEGARAYASKLLSSHAPIDAFRIFKKQYEAASIAEGHAAAHAFGEQLYEKAGVEGFSICDASFGFGCFHTFIPAAISDRGSGVIKELDQACVDAFGPSGLGCFHGIGHGLLAHEGYTFEGLKKALSQCAVLSWKNTYGGCREGVFMEYDFRTTIPDTSKQLRPYSYADRYFPCSKVDKYSRVDCYFSIPSWWEAALRASKERYGEMGRFCSEIALAPERTACYRGIGYAIAPAHNFDVERGISACNAAQKDGVECREGLAWALYAIPTHREKADKVCTNGLSAAMADECIRDFLFVLK